MDMKHTSLAQLLQEQETRGHKCYTAYDIRALVPGDVFLELLGSHANAKRLVPQENFVILR